MTGPRQRPPGLVAGDLIARRRLAGRAIPATRGSTEPARRGASDSGRAWPWGGPWRRQPRRRRGPELRARSDAGLECEIEHEEGEETEGSSR